MKKILTLCLMFGLMFGLAGCGGTSSDSNQSTAQPQEEKEVTYESILEDYSQQLKDATPGLVDEFNKEAKSKKGNVNDLATLCNKKVEKLAKICNKGVEQMAKLKLKNGDDDDTYNDWAGKLQDVYTDEAQKIMDAYTDTCME